MIEEIMETTYFYLNNAEQNLRDALKTSVDKSDSYQLKRIAEVLDTVCQIKSRFEPSPEPFTFTIKEPDYPTYYNDGYGNAYGDFIVGSMGTDTITFK
jgi:hypothetical protein